MQRFHAKNIVNHDNILHDGVIVVENGIITAVDPLDRISGDAPYYAVPGFIDVHTHGGDGAEVMDNSMQALQTMARFYLRNGTTSFLASTVTDSLRKTEEVLETVNRFLPLNRSAAAEGREAGCMGVHLEGPWLSRRNLGAQNPEFCIVPGPESLDMIRRHAGIVKMVTFSYHTPEAEELLRVLTREGIVPACGHDESIDERILDGFAQGIKVVTHIYCVTSSFQRVNGRKHLGTIEMALMTDGISVEVIADGKHITKHFWDFIRHNKSCDDILIVSDSMRCAGLPEDPEKVYKLGEMNVVVDQGVAWTADKTAFAGSVATVYSNFRRLVGEWNVGVTDAVRMTSFNQARLFGRDDLGEIRPGKQADFVMLDENLHLRQVVKCGTICP